MIMCPENQRILTELTSYCKGIGIESIPEGPRKAIADLFEEIPFDPTSDDVVMLYRKGDPSFVGDLDIHTELDLVAEGDEPTPPSGSITKLFSYYGSVSVGDGVHNGYSEHITITDLDGEDSISDIDGQSGAGKITDLSEADAWINGYGKNSLRLTDPDDWAVFVIEETTFSSNKETVLHKLRIYIPMAESREEGN